MFFCIYFKINLQNICRLKINALSLYYQKRERLIIIITLQNYHTMTTVTKENAETREIYTFRFDDVRAELVLISYKKYMKAYPKTNLSLVCSWIAYGRHIEGAIPEEQIPLTDEIKQEALDLFISFISQLKVVKHSDSSKKPSF